MALCFIRLYYAAKRINPERCRCNMLYWYHHRLAVWQPMRDTLRKLSYHWSPTLILVILLCFWAYHLLPPTRVRIGFHWLREKWIPDPGTRPHISWGILINSPLHPARRPGLQPNILARAATKRLRIHQKSFEAILLRLFSHHLFPPYVICLLLRRRRSRQHCDVLRLLLRNPLAYHCRRLWLP